MDSQPSANQSQEPTHPPLPEKYDPKNKKFPEKLMLMLRYAQEEIEPKLERASDCCLSWQPDGKSFVIRNKDKFAKEILALFFPGTLFRSFLRNLYRWGFQQIFKSPDPNDCLAFGNVHFYKDSEDYMKQMSSNAGAKRAAQYRRILSSHKPASDHLEHPAGSKRKRDFPDSTLQEKVAKKAPTPEKKSPRASAASLNPDIFAGLGESSLSQQGSAPLHQSILSEAAREKVAEQAASLGLFSASLGSLQPSHSASLAEEAINARLSSLSYHLNPQLSMSSIPPSSLGLNPYLSQQQQSLSRTLGLSQLNTPIDEVSALLAQQNLFNRHNPLRFPGTDWINDSVLTGHGHINPIARARPLGSFLTPPDPQSILAQQQQQLSLMFDSATYPASQSSSSQDFRTALLHQLEAQRLSHDANQEKINNDNDGNYSTNDQDDRKLSAEEMKKS